MQLPHRFENHRVVEFNSGENLVGERKSFLGIFLCAEAPRQSGTQVASQHVCLVRRIYARDVCVKPEKGVQTSLKPGGQDALIETWFHCHPLVRASACQSEAWSAGF